MDFKLPVCRIPCSTIVMNNGLMGGYGEYIGRRRDATPAHGLGGDYAAIGTALGAGLPSASIGRGAGAGAGAVQSPPSGRAAPRCSSDDPRRASLAL